ncbi:MAG TPA: hypothetical protein VFY12_02505 [Arenimonas sp.]|nr:hypothetical protein [Arenimonas sp.]
MWFAIGLITFGVSAWWMYRWRLANRWKGKSAQFDGAAYECSVESHKGRVTRVRIGIDCATGMHFCLKRENVVDRFFKGLGLSEEQQLNRLHFDERIYVLSDDKRLGYLLRLKSDLHAPLAGFFDQALAGFKVGKLWCRDRRLWIEAKPAKSMKTADCEVSGLAAEVLPTLRQLAELLASSATPGSGSPDHFFIKACVLTAISAALAVTGGVQLLRIAVMRFPAVVDHGALLSLAVLVGGIVLMLLLAACVIWLGRTSRMHVVLMELLLVGGFGSFATAYAELRDINIDFDLAEAQSVQTAVSHAYTRRCGKGGRSTCYHIVLAANGALDREMELQVNSSTYRALPAGSRVNVPLHAGTLGLRWIAEPTRAVAIEAP